MDVGREIRLRRLPYPYRAMLAIANDVDEATWGDFVLLHEFMNTSRPTPLGPGLDLEIGDSFFFYATASTAKTSTFSYFDGCNPDVRAPWAGEMDALIDAGYLDSLHSWGDFSRTGGFRRELAARAAEALRRRGRPVRVWINHGDACNEQMAGRPRWDDAASPHGHADIVIDCGLRYFWTGAITSIVGQDAAEGLVDRLRPARVFEDFVRPARKVAVRQPTLATFFGNHVMVPATVLGHGVQVFQRYGFWDKPTALELGKVISSTVLDELEERGGFLVLYTHLFRRPTGMPLTQVDWSPLAELSRRHRAGRIMVAAVSKLLRYAELRRRLRWSVHRSHDITEIRIDAEHSPEELEGVTFYVPNGRSVAVSVGGEQLIIDRNPPDGSGRESVSVPWTALKYPAAIHAPAS